MTSPQTAVARRRRLLSFRHRCTGGRGVMACEEDRRSILFCDIRGFSALAEATPPQRLAALVGRQVGRMAEVVVAHGGEVAALTGDGLMAVFAGSGHETHALTCALTMQGTLAQPDGIAAGIGVATGRVATMAVHWAGQWMLSVVGDVVNVAQRLESQAGPGEVLATEACIAGAAGVLAEPAGRRLLRGRHEAVEVYRVTRTGVLAPLSKRG
jgi:class 3 adenylate cyclase